MESMENIIVFCCNLISVPIADIAHKERAN